MYRKKLMVVFIILFIPAIAGAKSCKKYKSCSEVINDYPNGNFGRKDRDKDGIPCENVCKSLEQVEKLLDKKSNSSNKKDSDKK